ncbi:hypothetical protein CARUB_v10002205mg [Capsella rubella]|uniref:Josephin-like protein n=1 Tax=Capsella rubella TaxID=81985 RepID=R0FBY3_9BRAS|nr:uncharacterized protein LOC17882499 [Capsella rubella]EOA19296.1 hypothetical protein CARUB_v10002205mg [Capsella rubella]
MSPRGSKRVSFSPEPKEANDEPIFPTRTGLSSSRHGRRRAVVGIFSFGVSTAPAARRFLRRVGAGVGKTFRLISFGGKSCNNTKTMPSSSSFSCSSSSYSSTSIPLAKSKSLNESESHRAEAIEDCIEFLNSCSSLSRSNSISTTWSC